MAGKADRQSWMNLQQGFTSSTIQSVPKSQRTMQRVGERYIAVNNRVMLVKVVRRACA
jgi:hypothetical protein